MSKKKDIVYQNTDRELYREESEGLGMGYYANSVHVTKDGRIGMNVGGYVIVMPIAEWHALAKGEYKMSKEALEKLKELKNVHYEAMDALNKDVYKQGIESDDYSVGLYNGLELVVSMLEDREPKYLGVSYEK